MATFSGIPASIGLYGSTISPYSANNPQAIDAPRLYDQEGH
jgi:hypothetical protein